MIEASESSITSLRSVLSWLGRDSIVANNVKCTHVEDVISWYFSTGDDDCEMTLNMSTFKANLSVGDFLLFTTCVRESSNVVTLIKRKKIHTSL